jgi:hypothetical protein
VHDEAFVRSHIQECLSTRTEHYVDVEQEIVGAIDDNRVGIIKTNKWRIGRKPR